MEELAGDRALADDTHDMAGGRALRRSPELALVSAVLSSFVTDEYYRTGGAGRE
jgi:hypothetical protein